MTDFDGLQQLLLVEEFKEKVNADLKLHLDEQNGCRPENSSSNGW